MGLTKLLIMTTLIKGACGKIVEVRLGKKQYYEISVTRRFRVLGVQSLKVSELSM